MRKLFAILSLLVLSLALPALQLQLGVKGGARTVFDSDIRDVYGNGYALYPHIDLLLSESFYLSAGYEFSLWKEAQIGIFQEKTTLRVDGLHLLAHYRLKGGKLQPYLCAGLAYFHYKQTVESEYALDVDDHKLSFLAGAGVNYNLSDLIFLSGEVRYVPLKVKPYEEEVDLGGFRFLAGIGIRLGR